MHPFVPPSAAETFRSRDGHAIVWFPAPGVAAARIVGHVTGDVARRAYLLTDAQSVTPYERFIDMLEATGFDWEARGRALKWNILHLSPRMQLHALCAAPPLRVAFRVFEHALRDHFELHTERASFESAYALAIKRHTRAAAPSA